MKETIIEIKQLGALLFDDSDYTKFVNYIDNNQINDARLLVDKITIEHDEPLNIYQFELSIANKLSDLIIDLIMNEIDGERKGEQIKSIARCRE